MKKKSIEGRKRNSYSPWLKRLLIMKMILSLLMVAGLAVSYGKSDAQTTKLNLKVRGGTVKEVIKEVERQSNYSFMYDSNVFDVDRPISIDAENQTLENVVEKLILGQDLKYEMVNRYVVITSANSFEIPQQQKSISGKVTDSTGLPLPGVSVVVKGTTTGTITDANGNYSLSNVPENTTLQFSFVGMKAQEVAVAGKTIVNIKMEEDAIGIEEVIAIGYGTQRKVDVTGAISSVSGDDMANTPAINFLEQAQGKLAGVDIVRSSGTPGAGLKIRIRGNRSINASNEPLYVVDGIPTSAGLNDFNPNDIESVEVLKDASSVAIYGSRGANGVILITTKKGKEGRSVINYSGYYGIKQAIENLDLMNGQEFVEYFRISRGLSPDDNSKDNVYLGSEEIENLKNGVSTNWLDEVLQTGIQQEHQISASGSGNGVLYYLSGGYYDETGLLKASDYKRYSVRTNIESKLNDKTRIGISATASTFLRNQMSNDPYRSSIGYSPLTVPYDSEGNFVPYPNSREGLTANPLLDYQEGQLKNETKGFRLFSNIWGEYSIVKDLTYRLNFGTDYSSNRNGQYSGTLAGSANEAQVSNNLDLSYTLENILTYNKVFKDHKFNVVGLFSTQKSRSEGSRASGQSIPIEYSTFYDLGSASTVTGIGSSMSEWGLLSYMARVNYQFRDRCLLTVSGRADGSSRLSDGKKWAFFPATALGWIISEEDFFESSFISFLKLRTSYGEVGNTSINPYQTLGALGRTIYAFDETPAYGYGLDEIPNPDLRWEISRTLNAGLDFRLLDGRFSGSFEWYKTNTNDLLLRRLIPITSGYSSILQNVGSTRNRGWEFTGSANLISRKSGFNWNVDLNVFSNKEEIVELFNGKDDDVGNNWFIGQPISVFYTYKQLGIWQADEAEQAALAGQAPGDIKIADINGRDEDGNLTYQPDGVINSDDRTIIGSTVPKWSAGLTNNFSFKGFDLSVQAFTRQGQMLQSDYHSIEGTNWQGRSNHIKVDFWTPSNPSNKFPIPKGGAVPLYGQAVKYFDGSFVKIKNITLGYNFEGRLLTNLGVSSCRMYATASNAFIFSKYKTVDPEASGGVVGGGTPLMPATYIIGVNLKF